MRNPKSSGNWRVCLTVGLFAAVWVGMGSRQPATVFAQNAPNPDFRITQIPGDPVPLPTDGFSVRQMNGLWHEGSYYVYADIIDWTNPKHPASYGSSIGVYSSPEGRGKGVVQWIVPPCYENIDKSPLTAQVSAGKNTIDFDLPN